MFGCFGGGAAQRRSYAAEEAALLQHRLMQEQRDRAALQFEAHTLLHELHAERAKNAVLETEIAHAAHAAQEMGASLEQYLHKVALSGGSGGGGGGPSSSSASADTRLSGDQAHALLLAPGPHAATPAAHRSPPRLPYTVTSPHPSALHMLATYHAASSTQRGALHEHARQQEQQGAALPEEILQVAMNLRGFAEACYERLHAASNHLDGSGADTARSVSGAVVPMQHQQQQQRQQQSQQSQQRATQQHLPASAAPGAPEAPAPQQHQERQEDLSSQSLRVSRMALELSRFTTAAGLGAGGPPGAGAGEPGSSSSLDGGSSINSFHPSLFHSSQQSSAVFSGSGGGALPAPYAHHHQQQQQQQQHGGSKAAQRAAITRSAAALAGSCASIAAAAAATAAAAAARKASAAAALADASVPDSHEAAAPHAGARAPTQRVAGLVDEFERMHASEVGHGPPLSANLRRRQQWQRVQEQWQAQQQDLGCEQEGSGPQHSPQHSTQHSTQQQRQPQMQVLVEDGPGRRGTPGDDSEDSPNLGSPSEHAGLQADGLHQQQRPLQLSAITQQLAPAPHPAAASVSSERLTAAPSSACTTRPSMPPVPSCAAAHLGHPPSAHASSHGRSHQRAAHQQGAAASAGGDGMPAAGPLRRNLGKLGSSNASFRSLVA